MFGKAWAIIQDALTGFVADECLSRGAAIAYYTIFSLAPLLIIVTAIAGFFYGDEAAHGALDDQIRGMVGQQSAEVIQSMVAGAANRESGTFATIAGVVTLLLTASGVFGELQSSLNAIWKAEVPTSDTTTETVSRFVRAKAASIGLVAATGFILLVSLVVSTVLTSFGDWMTGYLPGGALLLGVINFTVSLVMIALLFGAIYKVLPDRHLAWRHVALGALTTAFLFVVGKTLIGWYLGSTVSTSTFGAAGAFVLVLLWVYYSSQIFLLGAEFTRAFAGLSDTQKTAAPVPATQQTLRSASAKPRGEAKAAPQEGGVWAAAGGVMMLVALARRLRVWPSRPQR